MNHAPMSQEEEVEREEALAEVADPMFLLARGDADADGDIEVDDVGLASVGLNLGTQLK
jgi:RNA polymerase II-associated factor 1